MRPFLAVLLVLVVVTAVCILMPSPWTNISSPLPQPSYNQIKAADQKYYQYPYQAQVRLWIDVPNTFPWRECLHLHKPLVTTYYCRLKSHKQRFVISPTDQDKSKIRIMMTGHGNSWVCKQPADYNQASSVHVGKCSDGYWRWCRDGLLEWSDSGYCLASRGSCGRRDST